LPAIEKSVRAVSFGIIELAPGRAVVERRRRFAVEMMGCPGAVMRLQLQTVVRAGRGQFLQPVG
jgi:hypothetical protein